MQPSGEKTVRKAIAILLVLLLAACGRGQSSTAAAETCPEPPGIPAGELLLFGEMHGSAEAPALVSRLACVLSAPRELAVGLEIPTQDQPLIDAFLGSQGTPSDVAALTSSSFWQEGKDGRSSQAMLKLIENIRAMKQSGKPVDLFAFDDQPGTGLERNVAIANGIRRFHDAHPGARIVALMGNVHAMQDKMYAGNETIVPSGYLLADLHPVSVLVMYPAGTIWACMPNCGIHRIAPRNPETSPSGFREGASLGGYSRSYLLPSITASLPAVPSK